MRRYLLLSSVFLVVLFTSCLKDDKIKNDEYGMQDSQDIKLIELSLTPTTAGNYKLLAFDIGGGDTTLTNFIPVTFAFDKPATEDIQVVLRLNPALLGSYNADNGTMHADADPSIYNILNPATSDGGYLVTIPKGSNKAALQVEFNPDDFIGHDYAMGFQIDRIETPGYTISRNFSTGIVAIALKNEYDGKYTYDVCSYHPTGNPGYDCGATTVELHTAGTNSVKVYWPAASGYAGPMIYNGGVSYFGSQEPVYTVDQATNKVDVTNGFSGATTFYTTITAANGYDTRYDPGTRTFYVRYGYNYSAGPTFNPASTREWTVVLTYTGPR